MSNREKKVKEISQLVDRLETLLQEVCENPDRRLSFTQHMRTEATVRSMENDIKNMRRGVASLKRMSRPAQSFRKQSASW